MLVWEEDVKANPPHPRPTATPGHAGATKTPSSAPSSASASTNTVASTAANAAAQAPSHSAPPSVSTAATSNRRVNVADKPVVGRQTDVNQLVPFKYKWAW